MMQPSNTSRHTIVYHSVFDNAVGRNRQDVIHYWDDKLHNHNGPAITTADGCELWFQYGVLHCDNGAAVRYPWKGTDGNPVREYWWHGIQLTKDEYIEKIVLDKEYLDQQNAGLQELLDKTKNEKRELEAKVELLRTCSRRVVNEPEAKHAIANWLRSTYVESERDVRNKLGSEVGNQLADAIERSEYAV